MDELAMNRSQKEEVTCESYASPDGINQADKLLTIGNMARLCGITVRTLRYYEEMDLIGPVMRSTGKYRLYSQRALKRIRAIHALQGLNYSLEEIVEILGPYSESLRFTKTDRISATRQSLVRQQATIEKKLDALLEMRTEVQTLLTVLENACEPCLSDCPNQDCAEDCQHRDIHL